MPREENNMGKIKKIIEAINEEGIEYVCIIILTFLLTYCMRGDMTLSTSMIIFGILGVFFVSSSAAENIVIFFLNTFFIVLIIGSVINVLALTAANSAALLLVLVFCLALVKVKQ